MRQIFIRNQQESIRARGFTLVELMVTISIIAILSVIGLTVFTRVQISGRDSKRIADMRQVQEALEQYRTLKGVYPNHAYVGVYTLSELNAYFLSLSAPTDPNISLVSGYQYSYYGCTSGAKTIKYEICARLEDCNGKCNLSSPPAAGNGCNSVGTPGSATPYYCLRSISE